MTDERGEWEVRYGHTRGKIFFDIDDDLYARFLVQLTNERMRKSAFLRAVIRGFVDDDPRIVSYLGEYRESQLSKTRRKKMTTERKRAKTYEEKFGLNEDELENIFDLLEEEQGI